MISDTPRRPDFLVKTKPGAMRWPSALRNRAAGRGRAEIPPVLTEGIVTPAAQEHQQPRAGPQGIGPRSTKPVVQSRDSAGGREDGDGLPGRPHYAPPPERNPSWEGSSTRSRS